MEKIRVYKLAQELNISSKKVIETAVKLSINVASHMSTLTADDSNKIRVTLSNASSKKETNKTVNQSKKKQLNQNYSEKDSDKILKKQDNKEKLKPSIISQPEAVDKNKGEAGC